MAAPETSERLASWKDRWDGNRIGWHETDVNDALQNYGDHFIPGLSSEPADSCPPGENNKPVRVFVPLCGKTVDMAYLAASKAVRDVVGVDGVAKALQAFASEQPQLKITSTPDTSAADNDTFERYKGNKIELLKGDFFQLSPEAAGGVFDVIFDRASMVAIEPSLRNDYVAILGKLLKPGGKIFLVTIERRSGDAVADSSGPPFSVPESEVRRLYEGLAWVESVTVLDQNGEQSRNAGTDMVSLYFSIQGKA